MSTEAQRKKVAENIKTQMVMANYGLPDHAEVIGLGNLSVADACRRIPAIRELWVRLDVWTAQGETMKGSIDYPEARRRVDYHLLSGSRPEKSDVKLIALTKPKRRNR